MSLADELGKIARTSSEIEQDNQMQQEQFFIDTCDEIYRKLIYDVKHKTSTGEFTGYGGNRRVEGSAEIAKLSEYNCGNKYKKPELNKYNPTIDFIQLKKTYESGAGVFRSSLEHKETVIAELGRDALKAFDILSRRVKEDGGSCELAFLVSKHQLPKKALQEGTWTRERYPAERIKITGKWREEVNVRLYIFATFSF